MWHTNDGISARLAPNSLVIDAFRWHLRGLNEANRDEAQRSRQFEK